MLTASAAGKVKARGRRGRSRPPVDHAAFVLDDPGRTFCAACLPEFEQERTRALTRAAKRSLSEMRTSAHDPAQSEAARRKRIEKAREMSLAARAWEREHGPASDPTVYERDVLPRM
jgi:hypothetical protein